MSKKSVWGCVKDVIKANKGITAFLLITALAGVLLSLLPPQLMRVIIDDYLSKGTAEGLYVPALIYMGVVVLSGLSDFLQGWLLTAFGQKTLRAVRSDMLKKLFRLNSRTFTDNTAGSLASRVTADAENINTLFTDGIISMAVDLLKIIGIVASVAVFSLELAVIVVILLPVIFFITRFFKNRMLSAQTKNLEQIGRVNGCIAETVENIDSIKQLTKEPYMESRYCAELSENFITKGRVIIYDSCYAPLIQLIRAVVISVVVILCAEQIGVLGISVGAVAATIDLISNLLKPVESLGAEIQSIQTGISGIKRVDEFLAMDEDTKDKRIKAEAVLSGMKAEAIAFDNLSFSYERDVPVLKNLTAAIAQGESVTISGRTGVGKSTLFSLIMGFLRPTQGRLLIGGFPAADVPDAEKRRIFGCVEQGFRFVPGTVAEQITLGDKAVTPEMVERVCTLVGLSEAISALSEGYETPCGHGAEFSRGQCQLLSIARAVVMDPPILLLDEITANLDSATEKRVMDALAAASRGRTVISVSHRESAMRAADRMIFLENGEITAVGTPDEVIALKGLTAE